MEISSGTLAFNSMGLETRQLLKYCLLIAAVSPYLLQAGIGTKRDQAS